MTTNNILSFFGEDISNIGANSIESYDWSSSSVDCMYILFMTGRCGSTWLTRLLEDSGMCGYPRELFNETVMPRLNRTIQANNFNDYFSGLVSHFSSGGRFGFKIDEWRLSHLLPLINFSSVFPKSNTRFFWMTRRDVVSQAFSFVRAKTTGHWHDFTALPEGQTEDNVEISDQQLWAEILDILTKESRMLAFFRTEGIEPISLNYEQMVTDRFLTVMNVMIELDCPINDVAAFIQRMEDQTLRLQFGNKYKIIGQFCAKYNSILRNITEQRHLIDISDIRKRLQSDFNMHP